MRRLGLIILIGLAVVLQVSFLPALRPLGVVPNSVLVMVVLCALYIATSEALVAAAICGLLLDLASGANFGLWTGVLLLATLGIGMLHRSGIELDRVVVAPALVGVGTLVTASVIWLGMAASIARFPLTDLIGRLVIELMINLALTMLLRPVVRATLVGRRRQFESGGA